MYLSSQEDRNKIMQRRDIAITVELSNTIPSLKIITLRGYFDLSTSSYVDETVFPLIEKGESDIILDVSGLDYLSSIGMMRLTKYQVLLAKKKRSLKLIKPSKYIYDTMTFFGFTKRFLIYDSVMDAVSSSL